AVFAVASRRHTLIIALLLAIPALVGRWINYFRPELVPPAVFLTAGLALIAFVVANLLRFVLRAPSVNAYVLCASISAYLMLGLIWTMAYLARGPTDARRSLLFQHERRTAVDQRVQCLLL